MAETSNTGEAGTQTVAYAYNPLGSVTSITTSGAPLGIRTTAYAYDALNRLSKVTFPEGEQVQFTYDALSRVSERSNSNQTGTRYAYTARNEVESMINYSRAGGTEQILRSYGYLYNGRGQRTFQVEGDGNLTAYQYDPAGQLTKVAYPFKDEKKIQDLKERMYVGKIADSSAAYFKFTPQVSGLPAGAQSNLETQINDFNTLLQQTAADPGASPKEVALTGNTFGYPVLDKVSMSTGEQMALAGLYQRIQTGSGYFNPGGNFWSESFTYDPNGNVTRKENGWGAVNYFYNPANQLTQASQRTFQYDANGNLVKETQGKYTMDYTYNPEDRLVDVKAGAKETTWGAVLPQEVKYEYDALGRRSSKQVTPFGSSAGAMDIYLYDGLGYGQLAEWRQGAGVDEYYYGNGELLGAKKLNAQGSMLDIRYYHQDALGSMALVTDSAGVMSQYFEYDVYGEAYHGELGREIPFGFTGQRFEEELGVYSFPFRDYNPVLMRWMEEDPLGDGLNWYLYCSSDPVNMVDPLGLCGEKSSDIWSVMQSFGGGLYDAGKSLVDMVVNWKDTLTGLAVLGATSKSPTLQVLVSYEMSRKVENAWYDFSKGNADVKSKYYGRIVGEIVIIVVSTKGAGAISDALKGGTIGGELTGDFTKGITSLYRAMGPDEFYDIMKTGKFSIIPEGLQAKQFGLNLGETINFANKYKDIGAIVEVKIPANMLNKLGDFTHVDKFIFKSGTVTIHAENLGEFNKIIQGISHLY